MDGDQGACALQTPPFHILGGLQEFRRGWWRMMKFLLVIAIFKSQSRTEKWAHGAEVTENLSALSSLTLALV